MKLKTFTNWRGHCYQSPAVVEIDVISEGILCESSEGGSTAEMFDRVEDVDGWGI